MPASIAPPCIFRDPPAIRRPPLEGTSSSSFSAVEDVVNDGVTFYETNSTLSLYISLVEVAFAAILCLNFCFAIGEVLVVEIVY